MSSEMSASADNGAGALSPSAADKAEACREQLRIVRRALAELPANAADGERDKLARTVAELEQQDLEYLKRPVQVSTPEAEVPHKRPTVRANRRHTISGSTGKSPETEASCAMSFGSDLQALKSKNGLADHIDSEIASFVALKDFVAVRVSIEKEFAEKMRKAVKKAKVPFIPSSQPVVNFRRPPSRTSHLSHATAAASPPTHGGPQDQFDKAKPAVVSGTVDVSVTTRLGPACCLTWRLLSLIAFAPSIVSGIVPHRPVERSCRTTRTLRAGWTCATTRSARWSQMSSQPPLRRSRRSRTTTLGSAS